MSTESKKSRTKRSAKDAQYIADALQRLHSASFKLPSHSGLSRFIDKIQKIQVRAHNLAFRLQGDAQED